MRAFVFQEYGDIGVLSDVELPIPQPGPDEVQINIRAISTNHYEHKLRDGTHDQFFAPVYPATLGSDLSGVVTKLGENVDSFAVGDEVYAFTFSGTFDEAPIPITSTTGVTRQFACFPSSVISLKPRSLSYVEAASSTCSLLTAYQSLVTTAEISPSSPSSIIIVGSSGGVGHFATQLCSRVLGCTNVIAVASESNRDFVLSLGATAFVDYREDIESQLEGILGTSNKVDFLLDCVGGTTCAVYGARVKENGVMVSVVEMQLENPDSRFRPCFVRSNSEHLRICAEWFDASLLSPHLARVFEWNDYPEAHRTLEGGSVRGKVAIHVPIPEILHVDRRDLVLLSTPVQTFLRLDSTSTIVDIGCGRGKLVAELAHRCPNARLIGIEPDGSRVNEANLEFGDVRRAEFFVGAAEDLTEILDSLSVDLFIFKTSFHHLADLRASLSECMRCLKPGGKILILEICDPTPRDRYSMLNLMERMVSSDLPDFDHPLEVLHEFLDEQEEGRVTKEWDQKMLHEESFEEFEKMARKYFGGGHGHHHHHHHRHSAAEDHDEEHKHDGHHLGDGEGHGGHHGHEEQQPNLEEKLESIREYVRLLAEEDGVPQESLLFSTLMRSIVIVSNQ